MSTFESRPRPKSKTKNCGRKIFATKTKKKHKNDFRCISNNVKAQLPKKKTRKVAKSATNFLHQNEMQIFFWPEKKNKNRNKTKKKRKKETVVKY